MAQLPPTNVTSESLKVKVLMSTHWLALACKSIPNTTIGLSNVPYTHGLACCELSENQQLWDKWVHGMFYELVSLHDPCVSLFSLIFSSIPSVGQSARVTFMEFTVTSHLHSLCWWKFWPVDIQVTWLLPKLWQNLPVYLSSWWRMQWHQSIKQICGGRTSATPLFQP